MLVFEGRFHVGSRHLYEFGIITTAHSMYLFRSMIFLFKYSNMYTTDIIRSHCSTRHLSFTCFATSSDHGTCNCECLIVTGLLQSEYSIIIIIITIITIIITIIIIIIIIININIINIINLRCSFIYLYIHHHWSQNGSCKFLLNSFMNTQILLYIPKKKRAKNFTDRFRSLLVSSTLEVASSCSLCAFVSNPCIGEGRETFTVARQHVVFRFCWRFKTPPWWRQKQPPKKSGGYVCLLHFITFPGHRTLCKYPTYLKGRNIEAPTCRTSFYGDLWAMVATWGC